MKTIRLGKDRYVREEDVIEKYDEVVWEWGLAGSDRCCSHQAYARIVHKENHPERGESWVTIDPRYPGPDVLWEEVIKWDEEFTPTKLRGFLERFEAAIIKHKAVRSR